MKERIDIMLVRKGFFDSREKAQKAIMAGLVFSKQQRIDKPGTKIDSDASIEVKGNPLPYVGRGGLKLEKALKVFNFPVENKIMLDIGSSTGGFTDCALQNGARLVYALDVGYNQLAWKLRNDDRVIVMERTNFRYSKPEDFQHGLPEVATMDVSFISIKKMLPVLSHILIPDGQAVTLIKPQFEAGKEEVGKKGIVKNPATHFHVIRDILDFASSLGYDIIALDFSPVTGGDGNIEFLAHLEWKSPSMTGRNISDNDIRKVVDEAHAQLK
ncbi:23S rRNA (cytidine1920-2'-O)/16S rRNA (cytidine1409-2'-O)-methyltransferase [Scopulibacillus daqui]|uniref:23S rRNA (Cytidine1920-2'-O)/16S rRNA (Cytidine1409-2'-O)-methyltransferase n=1 Tax=Scopulibacillus daqui TaxID=1469162 RepID=A0ABS2Q207_9BACL|nr:TlyA family RNA methyltransferase [Scopulibacillus daqui]MBM7646314.1 23S rRNA (cytidine1920-2'-O)/16S rRNA (cytidine1409-2'-O)-methyltransferase [Scopulibacillus daqui]